MHYLYIIYSKTIDKYYVGETPDVENRITQHNNHHFKTSYTKAADDWTVLLKYQCQNKKEALFLEKYTKRMKSRKFIEKIIKNPEILSDILKKQ